MAWTIKGRIESEESFDSTMLAQCRIEVLFEQKAPPGSEVPPVPKKISEISRRFLGPSNEPLNRPDSTPPSAEAVTIRVRVSTRPDES